MSKSTKMIIKIACVLAIFLPYKFVVMAGKSASFLQDFLVALGGYLLAAAVIALLDRGNKAGQ